mmetsp:Transcript_28229/g.87328  ORF Transcript_28229/g.87328 Transcript_28229/m.87328 type:complete len:223 (-) Transcript_28229:145-813(-)
MEDPSPRFGSSRRLAPRSPPFPVGIRRASSAVSRFPNFSRDDEGRLGVARARHGRSSVRGRGGAARASPRGGAAEDPASGFSCLVRRFLARGGSIRRRRDRRGARRGVVRGRGLEDRPAPVGPSTQKPIVGRWVEFRVGPASLWSWVGHSATGPPWGCLGSRGRTRPARLAERPADRRRSTPADQRHLSIIGARRSGLERRGARSRARRRRPRLDLNCFGRV